MWNRKLIGYKVDTIAMIDNDLRYKNFRFPIAIISHAVYLYNRFTLSYRDVSDLLF